MPRMSDAEKQKSHKRIVEAASRMMRENGVAATSVSDVMSAAGMTHGGFYRHFASKEELAAAAFRKAVDDVVAEMETAGTMKAYREALADYLETYLSQDHIENRALGCPLAALGAEAARPEQGINTEASEAVWRVAELLGGKTEQTPEPQVETGLAVLAQILGTVTLARLAGSTAKSEAILNSGRQALDLLTQQQTGN